MKKIIGPYLNRLVISVPDRKRPPETSETPISPASVKSSNGATVCGAAYVPDYSVRAITDLIYLKIDKPTYQRARKTSIMKRPHGADLELDLILTGETEFSPKRNNNNSNNNNFNNSSNSDNNNSIRRDVREFSLDNLQGVDENFGHDDREKRVRIVENGDMKSSL